MEISKINTSDIKAHDRTKPPKPLIQTQQIQQQQITNKENRLNNQTQNLEQSKLKYIKGKKESVSTDVSSIKSIQVRSNSKEGKRVSNSLSKTQKVVKKKKKVNKDKQLQEKMLERMRLDEEERQKQEEEERRRLELEKFRREQESKMTQEERERINSEKEFEDMFLIQFESNVYQSDKRRQEQEEWLKFLECHNRPSPDSEPELTKFQYYYDDVNPVNDFELNKHFKRTDLAEQIIDDIKSALFQAKSDNKYEKISDYQKYIANIRGISKKKIDEITGFLMRNQEVFFSEKNQQLLKLGKPLIVQKNLKDINSICSRKLDERYLFEIYREYLSQHINLGIWINVVSKAGYRQKPVEFVKNRVSIELPKQFQQQSCFLRYQWNSFDNVSGNQHNRYEQYFLISGIHQFECYQSIPLPVVGRGWAMKREYNNVQEILDKIPFKQNNEQFIKISLPLPEDQKFINEKDYKIVNFNSQNNQWEETGIKNIICDTNERIIKFETNCLNPFSIALDRCYYYPYKEWMIWCIDSDKAILNLETQRVKLQFEIGENYVSLTEKNDKYFRELIGKQLKVGEMIQSLLKKGINLTPENFDSIQGKFEGKEVDVENKALQELTFAARSFVIQSSKFNLQTNNDKILFQIRENPMYEKQAIQSDEYDWKQVCVWYNKCSILKIKENDKKFSEEPFPKTQTHSMLQLILQENNLFSEDCLQRMSQLQYSDFQSNIRRFLKLLRLLSFT